MMSTFAAVEQFWVDLRQRLAGKPDIFQSAYDDAFKPLTRNHSKLMSALGNAEALTAGQQDLISAGVLAKRKNLERFTCCTNQPPFRISAQGYWTQDTRLPSSVSDFMQQLGLSQPDESTKGPSIWQRVFGMRSLLLTTLSTAASQRGYTAYRDRFRSQQGGSPQLPRSPPGSAQHGGLILNGTARPLLRRQNAFRLTERESDRLSQQLGLSQQSHGASGHELLAISNLQSQPNKTPTSGPVKTTPETGGLHLQATLADTASRKLGAESLGSAAEVRAKDIHHVFNATAAYANLTRCNPQRWVHLHAPGVLAWPAR